MYHGSKSKSHQWGNWSDWVLDEQHRRYYRFRQDSEGNYDYDWDQRDSAAAAHAQTPRDTTINDITEGLKGLTTDYDGSIPEDHLSSSKSSKPKSKHRHRTGSHDEDSVQNDYRTSAADSLHASQAGQYDYMTSQCRSAHGYDEQQHSPDQDPEDEELADTIAASRQYNYNAYANAGESSASAYGLTLIPQYDEDEDEGPPTPKAQSGAGSYHITALEEPLEELDPPTELTIKIQATELNRPANFNLARPILTYGGKGCKKKGVKADKHGIIHERGSKPRLLDKEPKLGFPPVRVEMKEEGEKLSKESRVNYSKLVTVEHNVKVFFIGSILYNDWDLVSDAVNHCWNKKNHQKQRHR
ncbi:hypothetical protein TARUN_5290 [Trichoderma arundinaceum]|uniref:DUF6590 domain-containing protein n=1 Tax=Trichoderma arundinaceum TaxID=490622 RepID=A0A395NLH4_TRIAR|nr:hypothetical protein TARUN_5290 [Trichoderma arundinaceum]